MLNTTHRRTMPHPRHLSQLSPRHILRNSAEVAPWSWAIVGGALGLLLALVLLAPASWLAAALDRMTSGRMQVVETTGTVWTGSGKLMLTGGAGSRDRAALPGRASWKLRPQGIGFGLGFGLELNAECCTPQPLKAQVQPHWDGVSVQIVDGSSEWPAALLTGLGAPWNTLLPRGSLQLITQGLALKWSQQQLAVSGRAKLTAIDLTSSLTTLKPMGSYQVSLVGALTNEFKLVTLEGGLQLSGSGRWMGARLNFEGVASAAPGFEAVLANLLNIIGRRNGPNFIITLG